jgi:hypothetical protein
LFLNIGELPQKFRLISSCFAAAATRIRQILLMTDGAGANLSDASQAFVRVGKSLLRGRCPEMQPLAASSILKCIFWVGECAF